MYYVSKQYTSIIIDFKTLEDNIILGLQQNSEIPKYKNILKNTRCYFWSVIFKSFGFCSLFGKND